VNTYIYTDHFGICSC